jgi:hypothetical protein
LSGTGAAGVAEATAPPGATTPNPRAPTIMAADATFASLIN